MAKAVKLSDKLIQQATNRAKAMHRSTAKQIEYWANIGKIAEDNPDLSYAFIQNILIGMEEVKNNQLENYQFGEGKKR